MEKYIVYYRVSTKEQGISGLGIDAQKTAVQSFLKQAKAEEIPPSFTEIESGKNNKRPELRKAINRCKETGATLLIAKLDRLSRNIAFIFTLKEELHTAGVDFKALDLPEANTLTLGIMASMAQHEREIISQRTKAGLKEAKARGKILGNPSNLTDESRRRATLSITTNAREDTNTRHAFHFIKPRKEQGQTFQSIADQLNAEGYTTRRGKAFHAWQVYNIYKRFTE